MASPIYLGKRSFLLVVGATLILQLSITIHGAGADNSLAIDKTNCPDKCGNVSIPYPFGIGQGCYLHEDFEVQCKNNQASLRTRDSTDQTDDGYSNLLDINLLDGEARIQNRVYWSCKNTNGSIDDRNPYYGRVELLLPSFFKVSYTKNKFTAIGCATIANIVGSTDGTTDLNNLHYTSACASFCDSEHGISKSAVCDGLGCCQTSIPENLSAFDIGLFYIDELIYNPYALPFSPCSYAFVVEVSSFKFYTYYALGSNFQNQDRLPLVLDWNVGNEICEQAKKNLSSYACKATNSECINSTNGSGYRCNCSSGYEDINECDYPLLYTCHGDCTNTDGSYTCSCRAGTHSEDPKIAPCTGSNHEVKVVIGISVALIFLIICISAILIKWQKRKLAKEKERFFKQNGGHILYRQILSKKIDTVQIFTIEELKKATDNFDRSRELGTGGHGTVYKGILGGNKEVAVKRSKIINVSETEEFVQEIIILSQINHRNVVRLLGCCLEVEVPILVYEFIPNGTLFQLLHDNHNRQPVSLEDRLRIAQESAEALAYMHLSINHPIVHGDVKSLNILLGDNHMAKVSDFGASRMVPKDAVQFMTMVQGTLGYLDPEYLEKRLLTDKSDVYSFGVVILELITRKMAIYFDGAEEGKNLAASFLQAMRENRVDGMLDISILSVGMEELLQEVAELACLCLSLKGERRPSMCHVADRLKAIRSTWKEILLLKHEETRRLVERLGMASTCDMSPTMYWTAQMMGLDIETPNTGHASSTTNMG
ncbi:unnamed protein product [Urochloa decumbens]|uniref:Protein kinase domain-containing protein n=1 Tax=Urochloa decumbens TaxID=240449 RepID=A0ABC9DW69_9POAL